MCLYVLKSGWNFHNRLVLQMNLTALVIQVPSICYQNLIDRYNHFVFIAIFFLTICNLWINSLLPWFVCLSNAANKKKSAIISLQSCKSERIFQRKENRRQ